MSAGVCRSVILALLLSVPCIAQDASIFVSSRAGDRLAARPVVALQPASTNGRPTFRIDPKTTHQTIVGFGASFLEAGLICINSLPPEQQEQVLKSLFDPASGAGFSAMKTTIAGTDFMSAGPWYTYNDNLGDVEMKRFSIRRDLGPNGLVTFVKRARKYGPFVLQAPMDYPPDWMLVDIKGKQDVQEKYFDALALYYLRYLQEYQKQGIFIDYLSLFNEPGIYTKIPYTKIRDLIKNHVGPLLEREGIKTKLMLSESPNRGSALKEYPTVLDDPAARKYVAAMPYHGYDFRDFGAIATLHARYPDLPLWMTEICYAYEAGTSKKIKLPLAAFEDGDVWGNQIISDLEAGASAWLYWNMILDQDGGPWLVSPVHGNPDDNIQHPLVIIDRKTKQATWTGAYWYLAHFSKFVRPGAVRVETAGRMDGVRCVAFKSQDGRIVAQLMNSRREAAEVRVDCAGRSLSLTLAPISMTTACWDAR